MNWGHIRTTAEADHALGPGKKSHLRERGNWLQVCVSLLQSSKFPWATAFPRGKGNAAKFAVPLLATGDSARVRQGESLGNSVAGAAPPIRAHPRLSWNAWLNEASSGKCADQQVVLPGSAADVSCNTMGMVIASGHCDSFGSRSSGHSVPVFERALIFRNAGQSGVAREQSPLSRA
jgi:hypothetical protein